MKWYCVLGCFKMIQIEARAIMQWRRHFALQATDLDSIQGILEGPLKIIMSEPLSTRQEISLNAAPRVAQKIQMGPNWGYK